MDLRGFALSAIPEWSWCAHEPGCVQSSAGRGCACSFFSIMLVYWLGYQCGPAGALDNKTQRTGIEPLSHTDHASRCNIPTAHPPLNGQMRGNDKSKTIQNGRPSEFTANTIYMRCSLSLCFAWSIIRTMAYIRFVRVSLYMHVLEANSYLKKFLFHHNFLVANDSKRLGQVKRLGQCTKDLAGSLVLEKEGND